MTDGWITMPASEVLPGDRVRLADGREVIATRIETNFFGRSAMLALIEDTPDRWYKQPVACSADVEVLRGS